MINSIALDGNYVWCATDSGVIRYNKLDGSTVRYTEKDGLAYNEVRSVAIDHNGVKWFGTGDGVLRYDGNNWTTLHTRYDPWINSIIEINNQVMCFGSENGIFTYDGKDWNFFWWGGSIWKMIQDNDGMIWSACDSYGVIESDLNGNILNYYESPKYNSYYSAAIDSNSVLWFGGEFDLLKYDGKTWESIDTYSKHNLYYIRDMIVDKNNTLWLGVEYYGLYSYDGNKFIRYDQPYSNNAIFSIKIDESGVIWTGGSKGLRSFHPDPVEVKDKNPMSDLKILKNAPNPFNPSTTIEFTLPFSGKANLTIHDIMGRKVRELVSGQVSAGVRAVLWDGRDDSGKLVSSGVYFARLTMDKSVAVRKMLLMK